MKKMKYLFLARIIHPTKIKLYGRRLITPFKIILILNYVSNIHKIRISNGN